MTGRKPPIPSGTSSRVIPGPSWSVRPGPLAKCSRRTSVVAIFPNEAAIVRLVGAAARAKRRGRSVDATSARRPSPLSGIVISPGCLLWPPDPGSSQPGIHEPPTPRPGHNGQMAMLAANAIGRLAFRLGYWIAPRYLVRLAALRILTAPRRLSGRSYRTRTPDLPPSDLTTLLFGRTSLSVETWGLGPQVLLVHGWGFNRTSLSLFVKPLVSRHFRVIAFDMPAHGGSSGTRTSPLEMSEAIAFVAEHVGPVYAIVAHSIGVSAAIMAMARGLEFARSVFVAAPADPGTYYTRLSKSFGLQEKFGHELKSEVEHLTRVKSEDLSIPSKARLIKSEVLFISSRSDNVVPVDDARLNAEAFSSAQVRVVDGVGHLRILFDSTVIREAVDFICSDPTPGHLEKAVMP